MNESYGGECLIGKKEPKESKMIFKPYLVRTRGSMMLRCTMLSINSYAMLL